MKRPRIIVILAIITVALLAVGYATGFFIYEEYRERVSYCEQRISSLDRYNQAIMDKVAKVEKNLGKLRVNLEVVTNSSEMTRKDILSKIENIEQDVQNWQNEYKTALTENKEKEEIESVDLGGISLKRESRLSKKRR